MQGPVYCRQCGDKLPVCDWGFEMCDACKLGPDIIAQGHASLLDAMVAAEEAVKEARRLKEQIADERSLRRKQLRTQIITAEKETVELTKRGQRIKKAQEYKAKTKGADITDDIFEVQ